MENLHRCQRPHQWSQRHSEAKSASSPVHLFCKVRAFSRRSDARSQRLSATEWICRCGRLVIHSDLQEVPFPVAVIRRHTRCCVSDQQPGCQGERTGQDYVFAFHRVRLHRSRSAVLPDGTRPGRHRDGVFPIYSPRGPAAQGPWCNMEPCRRVIKGRGLKSAER